MSRVVGLVDPRSKSSGKEDIGWTPAKQPARIRFLFAYDRGSARRCQARQRGFVVGRRVTGAFLAAGFLAAPLALGLALARVVDFAAGAFLFGGAGFFAVVAAAPEATRDECRA